MTTSRKVYMIRLPLSLEEYRKGHVYTLCQMMTEDVRIVSHNRADDGPNVIMKTKKEFSLGAYLPSVVKSVIPKAAYVVEELCETVDMLSHTPGPNVLLEEKQMKLSAGMGGSASENYSFKLDLIDVETFSLKKTGDAMRRSKGIKHRCHAKYKNMYYTDKTFIMYIDTAVVADAEEQDYAATLSEESVEEIDFRRLKGKKVLKRVDGRDYSTDDLFERYPSIYLYKTLDVTINKWGLGWISKEIVKGLRDQMMEFIHNMISWYDEWKDLTDREILNLENKMLNEYSK